MTEHKKKQKKAVLVIEKFMYKTIVRKKYKALREKLAKIPIELRIVYFKYMALKKDTSDLVNSFNEYKSDRVLSPTCMLIDF